MRGTYTNTQPFKFKKVSNHTPPKKMPLKKGTFVPEKKIPNSISSFLPHPRQQGEHFGD
jgi:hypothetical protein